jgi:hypothetical protein
MTTVTDTAAASQGRAIAYWLVTALVAFALGAWGRWRHLASRTTGLKDTLGYKCP